MSYDYTLGARAAHAARSSHSIESSETNATTLHDIAMTTSRKSETASAGMVQQQVSGRNNQAPELPLDTASSAKEEVARPLRRLQHACLNLSPAFFSLNMGTGIASILLHNLPYNAAWLRYIGIVIFVLNIALFALLCVGNIVRYIRWKGIFDATMQHTLAGMFWGCLPMGMATIVNMIAFVCVPAWGRNWALLALGLWWINVIMSVFTNIGMLYMMFARQTHTIESISAALLLPIVSTVVAGASGGVVASALSPFDATLARSTVIVSYAVLGTGIPVAMFLTTLWMYRTAVVGLPAPAALPSLFLPLGPCGQGAFGLILLGHVVRDLAYTHNIGFTIAPPTTASLDSMYRVADGIYASCLVSGLILWGLGLVWYILAMAITLTHIARNKVYMAPASFSIGWTAYTFPIGVWATATSQLAKEFDSTAFKVIATVVSLQVVFQWAYVFVMAGWKAWKGTIFVAPELNKWEGGRPPLRFARQENNCMV